MFSLPEASVKFCVCDQRTPWPKTHITVQVLYSCSLYRFTRIIKTCDWRVVVLAARILAINKMTETSSLRFVGFVPPRVLMMPEMESVLQENETVSDSSGGNWDSLIYFQFKVRSGRALGEFYILMLKWFFRHFRKVRSHFCNVFHSKIRPSVGIICFVFIFSLKLFIMTWNRP